MGLNVIDTKVKYVVFIESLHDYIKSLVDMFERKIN